MSARCGLTKGRYDEGGGEGGGGGGVQVLGGQDTCSQPTALCDRPTVQATLQHLASPTSVQESPLPESYLVLRMMSCSKEGRRLLFAFLAALLQFAPSELTMFAAEQKDGNVIVTLNLFISSGTRQAFIFLPPPTNGSC